MRLNHDTTILGERVKLVPYRREHVAQYHEWMVGRDRVHPSPTLDPQSALCRANLTWRPSPCVVPQKDPHLLETTASEPLTIEVISWLICCLESEAL